MGTARDGKSVLKKRLWQQFGVMRVCVARPYLVVIKAQADGSNRVTDIASDHGLGVPPGWPLRCI